MGRVTRGSLGPGSGLSAASGKINVTTPCFVIIGIIVDFTDVGVI